MFLRTISRRVVLVLIIAVHSLGEAAADEPKSIYRQAVRASALVRVKLGDKTGSGTAWVFNRGRDASPAFPR